jgi:hypothetical protein
MRVWGLALAALMIGSAAQAATFEINAADRGHYSPNGGGHLAVDKTYRVGSGGASAEQRNFFEFNLAGKTGTVDSAILRLLMPSGTNGYLSPDPSETLTLFDVSTDPVTLSGAGGISAFNDLGTGTQYGSFVATPLAQAAFIDIILNSDALAAINASNGVFSIGGALTTPGDPNDNNFLFVGSTDSLTDGTSRLILDGANLSAVPTAVPLPPAFLLLGSALAGLFGFGRRIRSSRTAGL